MDKTSRYLWDGRKSLVNFYKHGLSFSDIDFFEWDSAQLEIDDRKDYGEERLTALGYLQGRLVKLVFTMRGFDIRIISLRKANEREKRAYDKKKKTQLD